MRICKMTVGWKASRTSEGYSREVMIISYTWLLPLVSTYKIKITIMSILRVELRYFPWNEFWDFSADNHLCLMVHVRLRDCYTHVFTFLQRILQYSEVRTNTYQFGAKNVLLSVIKKRKIVISISELSWCLQVV